MKVVPITLKDSQQFIAKHHRHNKPPVGHKFSIGLENDEGKLIGVLSAGRPISKYTCRERFTIEVNRSCTDGTKHANSMLYGAAWKIAKGFGYNRMITFTRSDESGSSLRAVGFVVVKINPISTKKWSERSQQLSLLEWDHAEPSERILWEIRCKATMPKSKEAELKEVRSKLENAFSPETSWNGTIGVVPSTGHCAVVSAILYSLYGGELCSTSIDEVSHWFNRIRFGGETFDVDLTGDQFGLKPFQYQSESQLYTKKKYPETRTRKPKDLSKETLRRAMLLATRANLDIRVLKKLQELYTEAR